MCSVGMKYTRWGKRFQNWFFLLVNEGRAKMKAHTEILNTTWETAPPGSNCWRKARPPVLSLGAAGTVEGREEHRS